MPHRWTQTEPESAGWDSTWRFTHGRQAALQAMPKPHLTTPAGTATNPARGTAAGETLQQKPEAVGTRAFYFALKRGLPAREENGGIVLP